MVTYIFMILSVLFAGAIVFLIYRLRLERIRSKKQEDRIQVLRSKLKIERDLKTKLYVETNQLGRKLRNATHEVDKAARERDAALQHLEKTLKSSAAEHVTPDRIATEVGRDGVYYSFSYNPPEFAEVVPIKESSAIT